MLNKNIREVLRDREVEPNSSTDLPLLLKNSTCCCSASPSASQGSCSLFLSPQATASACSITEIREEWSNTSSSLRTHIQGHDCNSWAKNTAGLLLYWVYQQHSKKIFYTSSNSGCSTGNIALITKGAVCTEGAILWHVLLITDDKAFLHISFLLLKSFPESVKINYGLILECITLKQLHS